MPPVIVHDARAYLIHPEYGTVEEVPVEEAQAALSAGYRAAAPADVDEARREEHFTTTGQQVGAFVESLASGPTLGASDVLLKAAGVPGVSERRQYNPDIALPGEILGGVVGLAIPGAPVRGLAGLSGRAGAYASRGAAKALGKRAGVEVLETAALPRLAGAVGREAAFGAGLGAGHAVSAASLQDMEAGAAAERVITELATGAAFGAGLGVLAFGAGSAARRVKRKFDSGIGKVKELGQAKKGLQAQRDEMVAEHPGLNPAETMAPVPPASIAEQFARLEGGLEAVSVELTKANSALVGKLLTRSVGMGVAIGLDGGITGGILGAVIAPRAVKALKGYLGGTFKGIGGAAGKAIPVVKRAREAWDVLRGVPVAGEAAEAAVQAAGKHVKAGARKAGERVTEAFPGVSERVAGAAETVGHGAGEALTAAVMTGTGEAALGGMAAGGAYGLALAVGSHAAKKQIQGLGDILMAKVVPAARIAALEAMTNKEIEEFTAEVKDTDLDMLEGSILSEIPPETPEKLSLAIRDNVMGAMTYIQQTAPPENAGPSAQRAYLRRAKTTINPQEMINAFISGNLTPEHVQTWEVLYPQALAQVRAMVAAKNEAARAADISLPRRYGRQVSVMMGTPQTAPRMYDPARTAALLQQVTPQQPGPKPRPKPVTGLASASATQVQRLQRGR